ncbi:MAG: hypothetical protein FJ125_16965 [Deltaproteobacteria bacterium]|nr:hypothetical protein [Deltaproteobacteria bacterium]
MKTFSALGKLYLENFEAIDAGWHAYTQDLVEIMAAVKGRLLHEGEEHLSFADGALQRPFLLAGEDELQLVLEWTAESACPAIRVDGWDELVDSLGSLFPEGGESFLRMMSPETQPQPAALLKDPVAECCRVWRSARMDFDRFIAHDYTTWRTCGWNMMDRIRAQIEELLRQKKLEGFEPYGSEVELLSYNGWPCHVQINSKVGPHKIQWWIGLTVGDEGISGQARLWCEPEEGAREVASTALGRTLQGEDPVHDWGEILGEVVAGRRSASEAAEDVSRTCVQLLRGWHKKMLKSIEKKGSRKQRR